MRLAFATLGLAVAAAAPVGVDSRSATEAIDRVSRSVPLASHGSVRVEATVGDVTITGSERSDLTVDIVRRAPRPADLSRFPAVIEATRDGVRIAAVQVDDGRDPHLTSDIVVRAPATAYPDAIRVFEGHVRVNGFAEGCDVDVRRGGIEATGIAGRVRLESGIGSIEVKDSVLTPGGMMRLRVFDGPVHVTFDRMPASARILAVTFNGTIASDIPLAMKDKFGPRFGEATLGTGDPVLSVDVVTGDIAIRVRNR